MKNKIDQVIEVKFTRCPECRSFSVRQTWDLTFKDKIKSLFTTVTIHMCDNCSYRFKEYGKLLTGSLSRKNLVIAALIVAVAIVGLLPLLTGSNGNEPIRLLEKKPLTQKEEIPKEIKKQDQQARQETSHGEDAEKLSPGKKSELSPGLTISGEIVLENSNRFGVNWISLGEGVQITRLSNGVLKKAGLLVGDILVEVDGKKIIGEGADLEIARDNVFYGKRNNVLIKVLRGEQTLIYKLVKRKII